MEQAKFGGPRLTPKGAGQFVLGVLKVLGFSCFGNSLRENDWRGHKRGAQAT